MSIADRQSRLGVDAGLVATVGSGTRITSWKEAPGSVSVAGNTVSYDGTLTGWVNTINSAALSSLGAGSRYTVAWTAQSAHANATWVVGLGIEETPGKDWRDVDFGFCFDGEVLTARENGDWIATANRKLSAGDQLQKRVNGTTLKYLVNGTGIARSAVASNNKLYVDTAFKSGAVTLSNLTLSH